jgi:hypothetical protein
VTRPEAICDIGDEFTGTHDRSFSIPSYFMNRWAVTDPYVFFGVAGTIVLYLLYMMIRRRKGERPGIPDRELDL